MNRKRDKPYYSRHTPYAFSKRRRSFQHQNDADDAVVDDPSPTAPAAEKKPSAVVVIGLPSECSVLDLKSRFEIYGPISRTRMDPNGLAYVTFRSHDAAQSAISAARDPSFQITLHSKPVQVMWATDPVPQWREGVSRKDGITAASSKLVRAEMPLSRRGRGNKLGSAIVNPREENNGDKNKGKDNVRDDNIYDDNSNTDNKGGDYGVSIPSALDGGFNGREIVAYDDIL